jgi:hypothetical protein
MISDRDRGQLITRCEVRRKRTEACPEKKLALLLYLIPRLFVMVSRFPGSLLSGIIAREWRERRQ